MSFPRNLVTFAAGVSSSGFGLLSVFGVVEPAMGTRMIWTSQSCADMSPRRNSASASAFQLPTTSFSPGCAGIEFQPSMVRMLYPHCLIF